MKINGRCYCGQVKFTFDGEPRTAVQCYCRECQYISGGNPNAAMVLPKANLTFTQGEPKTFARTDLETPRTRLFCGNCGTSLATLSPRFPDAMIMKVGTFDDPSIFKPTVAQYLKDKQPFHHVDAEIQQFETTPGGSKRPSKGYAQNLCQPCDASPMARGLSTAMEASSCRVTGFNGARIRW